MFQLSKPYTHLDVPAFPSENKPNYLITLSDIQGLVSPASNGMLFHTITRHSTDNRLADTNEQVKDKSRFAVRIEVSDKPDCKFI
jgi:hypothetical protein